MNPSLSKTRPQASVPPVPPTWECVVVSGDCYREKPSGVLFDVLSVRHLSRSDCHGRGVAWPNAEVTLRPIESTTTADDVRMSASSLCGSDDWERLPEDAETTFWGGGTKIGPVGAR